MSALGQKQTFHDVPLMSALPPKADIRQRNCDVRFVPTADMGRLIRSTDRRVIGNRDLSEVQVTSQSQD
jgi:hypothetical protein